jgi:hypothetical protein
VTVTSDAGWQMTLPEGQLGMTLQDGQDARYDVTFAARDLAPPTPMRRQLDPGGVLPDTIETLDYIAEMSSTAPGTSAPSRIVARRSPRSTCRR